MTAKINEQLIERIKELRAKGRTQAEIAVELKLSQGTISYVLRRVGLSGKLVRKK